jgi:uncharacterized repeat protein (TIGR03803 family)
MLSIVHRMLGVLMIPASLALLVTLGAPARANVETTVHDFLDPGTLNDGASPYGALVQDPATGFLFGTTRFGGKSGKGTVYCMVPVAGGYIVKVLHSFAGPDGADPTCALILSPSSSTDGKPGMLYGTTLIGGRLNLGTVFRIATNGTGFLQLHSFLGAGKDGANPYAGVIRASDGNLYGTTIRGGIYNQGTTYRLKTTGGADFITHNFSGTSPGVVPDGAHPYARLYEFKPGLVVGTTTFGGQLTSTAPGFGIVFTEALSGAGYTIIHNFFGAPNDGANPTAELIAVTDASGNWLLYGTTVNGGPLNGGTAYRLDAGGGSYSVIYAFGAPGDAEHPWAALVFDTQTQLLYGTSRNGGMFGQGAVYEMVPALPAPEAVIHDFDPFGPVTDGSNPMSALIINVSDALLYGTCSDDGLNFGGTAYNIVP